MNNQFAVKCTSLYKKYPLYNKDLQRIKGLFLPTHYSNEYNALSDINLTFANQEIVGIIGLNGSGKSTLAKIIAGITYPSEGIVQVNGEVNMLAANAGMLNDLTGIENIKYKCLLLGFDSKYIAAIQDEIIEFADIGIYINQPVRTYSSGMRSRLGFAISVHVNPDILIIDEALAVGDNSFTDKCLAKMNQFQHMGKTIIYISHSVNQIQSFCSQVVWLHKGKVLGNCKPEDIIKPYCGFAREYNAMTTGERFQFEPSLENYQARYL